MPKHKRESLIYTVMMCFVMVLWMSVDNVTLHMGQFGVETLKEAWLGFPVAYIFAMVFDWFDQGAELLSESENAVLLWHCFCPSGDQPSAYYEQYAVSGGSQKA